MSDKGFPTGQPDAVEEKSLFSEIMGDDDGHEAQPEQRAAPEPDEGEESGDEPAEDEQQDRGRDDKGRFARPEPKQDVAKQGQVEDRHAAGLRRETVTERGRRQTAEAERDAARREREADRQEMARLRGQLEQLSRQQQPAQQQPQQAPAAPDRWTDPEGYDKWRDAQVEARFQAQLQEREQQRARFSFEDAAAQHGQDAFAEAYRALDSLDPRDPANRAQGQRVMASPNPGEALMRWYANEKARREIGADPAAYRERLRTELTDPAKLLEDPATRERIIAQLRAEAGQGGQNGGPRSTYTLPPSLNGARGGNSTRGGDAQRVYDNSDRGVFDEIMQTQR